MLGILFTLSSSLCNGVYPEEIANFMEIYARWLSRVECVKEKMSTMLGIPYDTTDTLLVPPWKADAETRRKIEQDSMRIKKTLIYLVRMHEKLLPLEDTLFNSLRIVLLENKHLLGASLSSGNLNNTTLAEKILNDITGTPVNLNRIMNVSSITLTQCFTDTAVINPMSLEILSLGPKTRWKMLRCKIKRLFNTIHLEIHPPPDIEPYCLRIHLWDVLHHGYKVKLYRIHRLIWIKYLFIALHSLRCPDPRGRPEPYFGRFLKIPNIK